MANKKKLIASLSVLVALFLLFLFFFFVYFTPAKNEHGKIAKLPSHDLTLFVDEYGTSWTWDGGGFDINITYNGQDFRTKEDIMRILNNDTFVGSRGYCYFYDAQNNLFMKLSMDTHFYRSDGGAMYSISKYVPFGMYYDRADDPFRRALGLGPLLCWSKELSDKQSGQSGKIASARYWFLYKSRIYEVGVSIFSASFQLAFAFTLYLIPLIICLCWRNKKTIFCVIGIYVITGIVNIAYYFNNYPWLSW
jgi:hypothetical protein